MRMGNTKAGPHRARRRRRGRRPAHGPPLHRRRDPEGRAARRCAQLWKRGDRARASTCSARRRSPRPRPTATPRAATTRSTSSPRADPRRRTCSVKVSALTPLLRPDAPERGKRDAAPAAARAAAPRQARSTRTCTSTWSRSTRARRSPTSCSSCSPSREFRDGPSAGVVLQAYLRDAPELLDRLLGWAPRPPHAPARHPPRQGRLLGPRGRRGAPARLDRRRSSRRRPSRTARSSTLTTPAARGPPARPRRDRQPQPAQRRPRDRASTAGSGADDATSSSRSCAASATTSRTRSPPRGFRVRTYCPVGDLVAGMAYLVRRLLENTSNESFLAGRSTRGRPLEELLAAP